MFKIIIAMLAALRLICAMIAGAPAENHRAVYCRCIGSAPGYSVFEDIDGYTWSAWDTFPEWEYCLLILDTNRTEDITDDEITRILPLDGAIEFDGKTEYINSRDLTADRLENRGGALIIGRVIGTVTDADGNGAEMLPEDPDHGYISYRGMGFDPGDVVETLFIYTPYGDGVDDIGYRFDFKLF